jgi:putative NIF3 family GTP cyclohydrolase 1 type 2
MLAKEVYNRLEDDFIKAGISDNWYRNMSEIEPFLCENFKYRSMGLVCDFTETINHVYTAVFPTKKVLHKVLENTSEAMVFLHHPICWDLKKSSNGIYQMDISQLEMLKKKHISIYVLHHPLDNYSEYSTSKTLADALDIDIIKPFANINGAVCGIIGKTKYITTNELQKKYSEVVGHEIKLYQYGDNNIAGNLVAVCAGGGNQTIVIQELIENNIKTLITGISLKNDHSVETHELEKNNRINVLGGTHYSSEKFACIAMCKYFQKMGVPAEFIEDDPCYEDM